MKKNKSQKTPIILMILDGFGIRNKEYFNGVLNSNMKNYFNLWNKYPHTKLHASGPLVGLPDNQIGSSEVGHMTLGAGRLIKQPIVRINEDIETGRFSKSSELLNGIKFIKKTNGNIHLMGLLGSGGVHSSSQHLFAILDIYDKKLNSVHNKIFIHSFLDGRDTPQKSALKFLKELENKINTLKNKNKFIIATLCGRYYAMDRDNRWNRTSKAYNLLVSTKGVEYKSYEDAIESNYKKGITDEFIEPCILYSKEIKDNDLCFFYNFRSDRPKQLVESFTNKKFDKFSTKKYINLKFQTLTQYSTNFDVDVLYQTIYPKNTLGEVISKAGLNQLRISESEKFPHVTYFFSGLIYDKFNGEEQIKIQSPKVKTYDLAPEMSAKEVTNKVIKTIKSKKHDFILLNFANSDMVGHTGNYKAVLKAMREVDKNIGLIKDTIDKTNALLMITSDHGNCETMKDEDNNPHTKHTYNLVPFILCDNSYKLNHNYKNLSLYNIAPTILEIMNIKKPKIMSGKSLIKNE